MTNVGVQEYKKTKTHLLGNVSERWGRPDDESK